MERELPTYHIQGTDFLVDVDKFELREKYDVHNIIPFALMKDSEAGYEFGYCPQSKNIDYEWLINLAEPDTFIPQLKDLDPLGMSIKYNLPLEEIKKMSDFQIMVDQDAFYKRVNQNKLPTLDIHGNKFYVNIKSDQLISQRFPFSEGISLTEIKSYYDQESSMYVIPFNTNTHQFMPLDLDKITEVPKDTIIVSFPFESELDRIGWNLQAGLNYMQNLKFKGLKCHHTACVIPWQNTVIPKIIIKNLEKQKLIAVISEAGKNKILKSKNKGLKR